MLMGYERPYGYGLSTGKFGDQSETIEVHTAELNIARTSVLDYFADQRDDVLPNNQIFCWENGNLPEESAARFLSETCEVLGNCLSFSFSLLIPSTQCNLIFVPAFPQNQISAYISGEQHLIIKNYPEFACYRDISFYFKYFMNTETEAFPRVGPWTQRDAQLAWRLTESGYLVRRIRTQVSSANSFDIGCCLRKYAPTLSPTEEALHSQISLNRHTGIPYGPPSCANRR